MQNIHVLSYKAGSPYKNQILFWCVFREECWVWAKTFNYFNKKSALDMGEGD